MQNMGSRCVGFSSCGAWAWLPRGMWIFLEQGSNPSTALAGRFLTTGPPGEPQGLLFRLNELKFITTQKVLDRR